MNRTTEIRCLIVTSIFPPINGGSAVVYENICRYAPMGTAFVLTCRRDYATGQEIEHWSKTDEKAQYTVYRTELLRPLSHHSKSRFHSLWSLIIKDLPLKIKVLYRTSQIIKAERINIICIGELDAGSWLGLICRFLFGCKIINYIHGEEITTTTNYLIYGRNKKIYLNQSDAVIAVSQFTRQALIDLMGTQAQKIHVIENGVDIERFIPGPKDTKILQKHKLKDKKILLTVGRVVERKGIDKTLYAMPKIIKKIPNIHYIIVGTGEFRPQLDKIVTEVKLEKYVTFTGRIASEDLVKYYQTCDLFIMPNRELENHDTEGFGLVFLEANACEKAVIGGRAGGAVEAVQHNKTGLLVNGNDPDEIAEAVVDLISNNERRKSMEKEGLKTARNANWEIKVSRFFELCKKILQDK